MAGNEVAHSGASVHCVAVDYEYDLRRAVLDQSLQELDEHGFDYLPVNIMNAIAPLFVIAEIML